MTTPTIAPDAPDFITIREAAIGLNQTPWDVVQLIGSRLVRAVHHGRLTLVSREDIEQLGGRPSTAQSVPTLNLTQHPDPEAPQRQHLTQHEDPAGIEEPCIVFLQPGCPDDNGNLLPLSICVGGRVDLGLEQAGEVAQAILALIESAQ